MAKQKSTSDKKKEKVVSKKQPTKRFEIRVPNQLFSRLEKASNESGFSRTAIILRGLDRELKDMEK